MTEDQFAGDADTPETDPEMEPVVDPDTDAETDPAGVESMDGEPSEAGVRTGVEQVDDVLGTLEGLEDQPVEEHLPIFEAAHEQLRGALDGSPDESDAEPQSD